MRVSPRVVILAVIFAVVGVFVVFASQQNAGTKQVQDGVVTQVISQSQSDSQATFAVVFSESDPEHESSHIFDSLKVLPGIATAAVDTASAQVRVDFDSKQIDEPGIRAALLKAGYVRPTAEDATPAVLSSAGDVQTLEIGDDHGFQPAFIRLAAGVPAKLSFATGTECRTVVKFPELGIEADLTKPAVVDIPALQPGTYSIVCSQDAAEGQLIVQ